MALADPLTTLRYRVLGVELAVGGDAPQALTVIDETYAAFRCDGGEAGDVLAFGLAARADGSFSVSGADGAPSVHADEDAAAIALLDRIVHAVLRRLAARGVDAVHAGAVVHAGRGVVIAGPSGRGKTTLTLGLVVRGAQLLSDELAVLDRSREPVQVTAYRRSVHVRPGTPELIPALAFVHDLPRHTLGGGSEWSVQPALLEQMLPGCLGTAAPLRNVLLLGEPPAPGREARIAPVVPAVAAMELLRGTFSASLDFPGALRRVGGMLAGVRCARLDAGSLDATLDAVTRWVEDGDGR